MGFIMNIIQQERRFNDIDIVGKEAVTHISQHMSFWAISVVWTALLFFSVFR